MAGRSGSIVQGGWQVGFLDQTGEVYSVHDLWDHAPDYVRKRYEREKTRKLKYSPRNRGLTAAWRSETQTSGASKNGSTSDNIDLGGLSPDLGCLSQTKADLGSPPSPTLNTPLPPKRGNGGTSKEQEALFARFYEAYPRHVGRAAALKAWTKLKPDEASSQRSLSRLGWQKQSPDWLKDDGRFVPHPSTWLNNSAGRMSDPAGHDES